jgi:hypothetical protein
MYVHYTIPLRFIQEKSVKNRGKIGGAWTLKAWLLVARMRRVSRGSRARMQAIAPRRWQHRPDTEGQKVQRNRYKT